MSIQREDEKDAFLRLHGWGDATRSHLAGDASFRSYERIHRPVTVEGEETEQSKSFSAQTIEFAVLMDAPPPDENIRPFVYVAKMLQRYGLNTPNIIAENETLGLLLLEDFNDSSFNRVLPEDATLAPNESSPQADILYKRAVDVLLHLHQQPIDATIPAYDTPLLLKEVSLLTDWYISLYDSINITDKNKDAFLDLWVPLLESTEKLPPVTVLRDYHADNLMWLDGREGLSQVGILDFQDAVNGSPAYDLVSLLEDVRRDVGLEFAEEMIAHYLAHKPSIDSSDFRRSYAILGAQRNIKILGIFARLCLRDGKPDYLDFLPRVWRYLEHDLQHPDLHEIKAFMDCHFPPEIRKNIPDRRPSHANTA